MKKTAVLLIIALALTSIFVSCFLFDEDFTASKTKKFWAQNAVSGMFYQLSADLLYENHLCKVWVEQGRGVSAATAQMFADEYLVIYDKLMGAFGKNDLYTYNNRKYNTMSFADALSDGDGKLSILLLDIRDNYKQGVNESYVAGYFYAVDFFSNNQAMAEGVRSNECDMIYIDINPGINPGLKFGYREAYSTLAHEMQHLMNFVTTVAVRSDKNDKGEITELYPMDTWIDEGLSSAAEWLYLSEHPPVRWKWYNMNGNGDNIISSIDKGNNFFVWGNEYAGNPYSALDDYATVYLFFQWLRLQSGGSQIYKQIILSGDSNYSAVTSAASGYIELNYSWGRLLRDWLSANFINDSGSRYGYKNDSTLKDIKGHYAPTAPSIQLFPGEGVYSYASMFNQLYTSNGSIKYAGLNNFTVSDTSISGGDTMLSYNINTLDTALSETGNTTNTQPPLPPGKNANLFARSAGSESGTPALSGPFPIGMQDALKNAKTFNGTGMSLDLAGELNE